MNKKNKSSFLDKLAEKLEDIKTKGLQIGKTTVEEASKVTEGIKVHGKEKIDEGISEVKKRTSSSDHEIEILEKLAKLKEAGIITQKEFEKKKKEILDKI